MSIESISVTELYDLHQKTGKIALIDVREVDEFAEISTPLAENFPMSHLDIESIRRKYEQSAPLYVICKSGGRSMRVAGALVQAGFKKVYNVDGGMMAWDDAELPVACSDQ